MTDVLRTSVVHCSRPFYGLDPHHMTLGVSCERHMTIIVQHSPSLRCPLNIVSVTLEMSGHFDSNPSCPLNLRNLTCPRFFVNMSAGFSAPSTKYKDTFPSSTHCLT